MAETRSIWKTNRLFGFYTTDTIIIKHTADDGRENSAYIVPDQGIFGPEWALFYTIPGFKKNLLTRFNLTDHMIYSTFAKYLQGKAKVIWEELLNKEYPNEVDRTTNEFDVALMQ